METGKSILYGIDYYEGLLRIQAKSGEDIASRRWGFLFDIINESTRGFFRVLDYGCGAGFFRAFRPCGVHVDSYDVMSVPQTGIKLDEYDLVCFWDVLEHLPNFGHIKTFLDEKNVKFVAATVPIVPEKYQKDPSMLREWKHHKPGEHIHCFTEETFVNLFNTMSFKLIKSGTPECPPREDIGTFLFQRVGS